MIDGTVFGVKTAVDEFADAHRRGDFVLHFPDTPPDQRLAQMLKWEQFAG